MIPATPASAKQKTDIQGETQPGPHQTGSVTAFKRTLLASGIGTSWATPTLPGSPTTFLSAKRRSHNGMVPRSQRATKASRSAARKTTSRGGFVKQDLEDSSPSGPDVIVVSSSEDSGSGTDNVTSTSSDEGIDLEGFYRSTQGVTMDSHISPRRPIRPPSPIVRALETQMLSVVQMQRRTGGLPFLRRNLRSGFVIFCKLRGLPVQRTKQPSLPSPVKVLYRHPRDVLESDTSDVPLASRDWHTHEVTMDVDEGWMCPICSLLGYMPTKEVMLEHAKREHVTVNVKWWPKSGQLVVTLPSSSGDDSDLSPDGDSISRSEGALRAADTLEEAQSTRENLGVHSRPPHFTADSGINTVVKELTDINLGASTPLSDSEESQMLAVLLPQSQKSRRVVLSSDSEKEPEVPRRPLTRSVARLAVSMQPQAPSPIAPSPPLRQQSIATRSNAQFKAQKAKGKHLKHRPPPAPTPIDIPARLTQLVGQPGFAGHELLRPPRNKMLGPAIQPPYLPAASQDGTLTLQYSCRPGGARLYDLLDLLPLSRFGDLRWVIVDKEEALFDDDDLLDEDKVMMALWARWILLNRVLFIKNYLCGLLTFLDENWWMIHHAAGWSALRVWVLNLLCNKFLSPEQAATAIKYYEQIVGMTNWYS